MLDSRPFKPLGGLEVEFAGQRVVACEELRIGLSVAVRGVLAELIDCQFAEYLYRLERILIRPVEAG